MSRGTPVGALSAWPETFAVATQTLAIMGTAAAPSTKPEGYVGLVDADEVIELLGFEPLAGEGGQWAQTWRDEHSSAIYFLLRPGDFSALHRLGGVELWHYYSGAAVEMLLLEPDGAVQRPRLGDDLAAGERPVVVVGSGAWMAAGTTGEWSLVGTTMAPPFDESSFEIGDRATLSAVFPEAAADIRRFTQQPPDVVMLQTSQQ